MAVVHSVVLDFNREDLVRLHVQVPHVRMANSLANPEQRLLLMGAYPIAPMVLLNNWKRIICIVAYHPAVMDILMMVNLVRLKQTHP